jgi:hypothetical protein
MKTIIICTLAVLFAGQSFAQIGVITLKKKEAVYYGQWFTVKGTEDRMFFVDERDYADLALNRLLSPYELSIDDGQEDEEGDLMWEIQADNGFISTVYRILQDDNTVLLMIITEEAPEEDDFVSWYEKVFH